MKITKKCLECTTRFEAKRSDAKYCSDACKVRAHYHRGKARPAPLPEKKIFYMDEYDSVCNIMGTQHDDMPFILYCFLRKNLTGKTNPDQIADYINATWINIKELEKRTAYKSFEDLFLSGEYIIKIEKESENMKKIITIT